MEEHDAWLTVVLQGFETTQDFDYYLTEICEFARIIRQNEFNRVIAKIGLAATLI